MAPPSDGSASSKGDVTPGVVFTSEPEAIGFISGVGAGGVERLGTADCLLSLELPSVAIPFKIYTAKKVELLTAPSGHSSSSPQTTPPYSSPSHYSFFLPLLSALQLLDSFVTWQMDDCLFLDRLRGAFKGDYWASFAQVYQSTRYRDAPSTGS